jgi:hypothetical protein
MPFTPNARSEMLRAIVGETLAGIPVTHASLHTADPSTTGANEVSGGSPAYARKAVSFNAVGTDGVVETSADAVFDVPASTTVTYVGLWSASTGGTFLGSMAVSPSESFGSQGTFTLNSGTQFTLS